jgi:anti-sigma factor RsiW
MSIDPEMLMAYVDGELDPIAAKRIERAAEGDPALAGEIARHRQMHARLRSAFDPVASAPPSDALVAMLRDSGKVIDIAGARARGRALPRWLPAGGAVAAALALGLVIGRGLPQPEGLFATHDGTLVARGETAQALDAQLASAQAAGAPIRVLVTFRRTDGDYCRAFETREQAAIACRRGDDWRVQSLRAAGGSAATEYRQAGSASAALMAEAQDLMAGEPLDAAAEQAAIAAHWSAR